jgi:hypothetical protein
MAAMTLLRGLFTQFDLPITLQEKNGLAPIAAVRVVFIICCGG